MTILPSEGPSLGRCIPGMPAMLTPAFASNLENLMDGDRLAFWVHGHMHESYDYEIYGTRVVCNPRGYAPDALNPDFRPDLVMEV